MMFLLGLTQMSMAQGATAHAVLQASHSLSLDAYAIEKLTGATWTDGIGALLGGAVATHFAKAADCPYFVTDTKWYRGGSVDKELIENRFVGYLAGGDRIAASAFLKMVRVVGDIEGLDFSESQVIGEDLYVTLKYKVEYAFRIPMLQPVDVEQTAVTRLWK
jgi:hypothetical protein